LASPSPEQTTSGTAPSGKKPKRKLTRFLGIAVALVIIILVLAFIFSGSGSSPQKTTFSIIYHTAFAEPGSNISDSFNVTVYFTFNNTGSVPGNATIIFKVMSGSYTWAGAQIFNDVQPGQVLSSYKEHIPVTGDPNDNWVYECYVNGEKAVKYPHP
jgi:hypothetical protein